MTLLELEKARKDILRKFKWYKISAFFATFGIFIVAMTYFMAYGFNIFLELVQIIKNDSLIVRIIAIFMFIIFFYIVFTLQLEKIVNSQSKEFRKAFKQMYLAPYIKKLGYSYINYSHVNAVYLVKSRLFPSFSNQYGDDQISGNKNGVLFTFSDIYLEDRDDTHKIYLKLFQGLFFMANFNKNISSNTFVMQGNKPRQMNGLSLINMDNPIFNTKFQVYSDNIQNAMYILSPALMERINSLSNHMKCPLRISFIDGYIFIAIENNINNFEPDIHKSVITTNQAEKIKKDLEKILDIVNVLSLDSNLWINFKDDKKLN
ncbi:DUF3137 domain-containing membrane protein [Campylobacter blaseri]|uniref:Galanin n=1 Tax=Campylobacter blaseri TaxID=2042961 RepID=A0A2P8R3F2_9BACT|nr:DUF3137 domain-containing protein [Campylobacter blaseri]PSM53030.1 hypothetical protein CQ405_00300 [Campylobacter blaseri]PSM54497.1 hypothetical protein CRN67_00300 [Campylobacter blaseri]QKF85255.1 DUF3137 domain-containing membrane protein [Campylobacter blaseri]